MTSTNKASSSSSSISTKNSSSQCCPYLDTITRTLLDFDLPISCSVTLSSGPHIYACLVCGQFFRGKGPNTPAHTHSVETGHAVYVHLTKGTFWCLPDGYEIVDSSLDDIQRALRPRFSEREIGNLDSNVVLGRDLFGRRYVSQKVFFYKISFLSLLPLTLFAALYIILLFTISITI
jgi:U4/U6.U5 tri-snRNP-associated protein 2